jgi:ribonuclease P protein component
MSDEAHLPAEQARPRAPSRLPLADGDAGRPQGSERAPRAGPQAPFGLTHPTKLGRVTRRTDYLAANRGRRAPTPGFVLLVRDRGDGDPVMRIGITVSSKVGGAVIRNRMKRRFRELARAVLPLAGVAGADHILIGRKEGIERDFGLLRADLERALSKLRKRTALPEPVEGRPFSSPASSGGKKNGPSTSSGKAGLGDREGVPR